MPTAAHPALFLILLLACAGPAVASHAHRLGNNEKQAALSILRAAPRVRHFCAPCRDTSWREERVRRAEAVQAGQPDEWYLLLNGEPIDIAYVYVPRNGRWRNLALLAGIRFPEIPEELDDAEYADRPEDDGLLAAAFTWMGRYEFEDWSANQDPPTSLLFTLSIFEGEAGTTGARLSLDGLDVFHRMECLAREQGNELHLILSGYLRENYGEPYGMGDTLATLVRRPGGEIQTAWRALKPRSRASEGGFERIDLNPWGAAD